MVKDASSKGYGHDSKGRVKEPPASGGVGASRKADMKGAQGGGSRAEGANVVGATGLSGAVGELRSQHPHHHSAGGIHGTMDHRRHVPMHGLGVK